MTSLHDPLLSTRVTIILKKQVYYILHYCLISSREYLKT